MNRIIYWEKWSTPLDFDPQQDKKILEQFGKPFNPDREPDESFSEIEDKITDLELDDEDEEENKFLSKPTRLFISPFGILVPSEQAAPNQAFNFWIGHTNFKITENEAEVLEAVDGIESLDFFSRYRFRIGIGKAFNTAEVFKNIDKDLNIIRNINELTIDDNMLLPETLVKINLLKEKISKYKYWAIAVLPNEEIDFSYSDDNSPEHIEKVNLYKSTQELVGGIVLTNDNL